MKYYKKASLYENVYLFASYSEKGGIEGEPKTLGFPADS